MSNPLEFGLTIAVLAMAPLLLISMTSFVKLTVVLSLLRNAIGIREVPSTAVITALALALSLLVMAPVGEQIWHEVEGPIGALPAEPEPIELIAIAKAGAAPARAFLLKHADQDERLQLHQVALELRAPEAQDELASDAFEVLIPAFVLTELTEAFMIGFLLFLPFLVVDVVVAATLASVGLSLPVSSVSLPFKLLLFVLADGWYIVVHGLILGYA